LTFFKTYLFISKPFSRKIKSTFLTFFYFITASLVVTTLSLCCSGENNELMYKTEMWALFWKKFLVYFLS